MENKKCVCSVMSHTIRKELMNYSIKNIMLTCYKHDPCKPMLLYTGNITVNPFDTHTYQVIGNYLPLITNLKRYKTDLVAITRGRVICIFKYSHMLFWSINSN